MCPWHEMLLNFSSINVYIWPLVLRWFVSEIQKGQDFSSGSFFKHLRKVGILKNIHILSGHRCRKRQKWRKSKANKVRVVPPLCYINIIRALSSSFTSNNQEIHLLLTIMLIFWIFLIVNKSHKEAKKPNNEAIL